VTTSTSQETVLLAVLADGVRAPSAHNTQPWRFVLDGAAVHVHADRTRALPVNDPYDRELTISCGAALGTIEIAARGRGLRVETVLLPDDRDPDLFATIRLGSEGEAPGAAVSDGAATDARLAAAIATRQTYRGHFAEAPLPDGTFLRLVAAAEAAGASLLEVAGSDTREDLASVVASADRTQFGDPSWRRELAMWTHPDRASDGMPMPRGTDLGTRLAPTAPGEPAVVPDPDRSLVLGAPLVAVLATTGDRDRDWLGAGRALQRVLLTAAADGIQASYLNQACQVADARNGVRYLIGGELHPQAILRFGVPAREIRRTRRRPLEDVVAVS
jgi:hypothetical protein